MPPIYINRRVILILAGGLLIFVLMSGAITKHVRPDIVHDYLPNLWESKLNPPVEDPPAKQPIQPWQEEIFPLAKEGKIPKINTNNIVKDNNLKTPLFIGFTRNWYLLEQAVVSYLAAGWPAKEILVIDNTGTMDSNLHGLLTPKNPWYLNYTRLNQLGVTIKRTPTLLTFAQLQNFYINYAVEQDWEYFFWSHMDVVVLSKEDATDYKSFYERVVNALRDTLDKRDKWAHKFFAYDWLTLVSVAAMKDVGGWDTQIPYYMTDCDMYERLYMHKYTSEDLDAGWIYDMGSYLLDLAILYPVVGEESQLNTTRFHDLKKKLERMMKEKRESGGGRNSWQVSQNGGQGEPFWRNPTGFERAIGFWIDKGRELFKMKWDHPDCDIIKSGRKPGDEWTKGPGNQ